MNKKTTTVLLDKSKAKKLPSPDVAEISPASQRQDPFPLENTIDVNDIVDKMKSATSLKTTAVVFRDVALFILSTISLTSIVFSNGKGSCLCEAGDISATSGDGSFLALDLSSKTVVVFLFIRFFLVGLHLFFARKGVGCQAWVNPKDRPKPHLCLAIKNIKHHQSSKSQRIDGE